MEALYRFAHNVSRYAAWVSGGILFLAAAMVTVEVVARKFFLVSLGGSDELAGYALAISTSWGISFTLVSRANIRIDALYMRLSSRVTAFLDLLGLLAMAFFMAFVAWFSFHLWITSIDMGARAATPLGTPLIYPQGIWVAGFLLFLFVISVLILRVLQLLLRGDVAGVSRVAGIRSVAEEMDDEVSAETRQKLHAGGDHRAG